MYKRTTNKVEWCVLDIGGFDIYKSLYATFFSAINHAEEPTVFIVVYNHTDYTPETHKKHLGAWIESILTHSNVDKDNRIRIKLIGLVKTANELTANEENEAKIKLISSKAQETIINVRDKLEAEKSRLKELQAPKDLDSQESLEKSLELLDRLIERNVMLYEDISLIDSAYKRDGIEAVVNSLETLTIALKKVAHFMNIYFI